MFCGCKELFIRGCFSRAYVARLGKGEGLNAQSNKLESVKFISQ